MMYLIPLVMALILGWSAWRHRPPKGSRLGWKIGCGILAFGFWGFAIQFFIVQFVPNWVATPITIGVSDLDLDAEGNIYVATINGRVQVFDRSGAFKFAVQAGSNQVRIKLLDGGFVARGRFSEFYRFDRSGTPLVAQPEDFEMDRPDFPVTCCREEQIDEFWVRQRPLNQIAVYDDKNELKVRIFPNMILVPFFLNPVFGWFMVLLGAIIVFIDSPLERRRRWWQ